MKNDTGFGTLTLDLVRHLLPDEAAVERWQEQIPFASRTAWLVKLNATPELTSKLREQWDAWKAEAPVTVTVIQADGTSAEHPYPTTLKGWQAFVGGYIEVVQLKERLLIVDEDGLGKNLPVNLQASRLARRPLVGPAVLVQGPAAERWFREG